MLCFVGGVGVTLVYCCFFFFKQKTADEMRISDWSSDVCSSDLGLRRDQLERGLREVRVSEADVRRNVASVTEEDAVAFMKLGALPSYSVALVRSKTRDEAALLGVDAQAIRKARGSGRLLFVDKR